jgi:hypothetical protein
MSYLSSSHQLLHLQMVESRLRRGTSTVAQGAITGGMPAATRSFLFRLRDMPFNKIYGKEAFLESLFNAW